MLIVLPTNEVSQRWDLFKDVLRSSIPRTKDMLPNWLTDSLHAALCGRIQCWLAWDPDAGEDSFYAAFITKKVVDELTGQRALLIYAMKVYKRARREVRIADLRTLQRIAKSMNIQRLTAYCLARTSVNALKKAFPQLEEISFVTIPLVES